MMIKTIGLCFTLFLSINLVSAQNLIYTISGEVNSEKVALDSILIENISNSTSIVFGDLPVQNSYQVDLSNWDVTGLKKFIEPTEFKVSQNIPGSLIITNQGNNTSELILKIYNISGQIIYSSNKQLLYLNQSIKIEMGSPEVFIVKLNTSNGSQSFKTIGSFKSEEIKVSVIEKNNYQEIMKGALIYPEDEFNYHIGDSIQISVFKKDYLSISEGLIITNSESLNFNLYDVLFTDLRDDTIYQTVKIGNQIWLAENMKYLPEVNPSTIESSTEPLYYVNGYEGTDVAQAKQTDNYKMYGVLYNWTSAQSICPDGWHLPSENEWRQLELSIGMTPEEILLIDRTGIDEGIKLKSKSGWNDNNGTNESGFSALPGGNCCPFGNLGNAGFWWASTPGNWFDETGMGRALISDNNSIILLGSYNKFGFSVRCMRD